jgi:hypothetical protein
MAYEAAVGREEQISIGTSQSGQSVKCYTIYSHEDQSRETGLWVELDPVCIVVIGHEGLFYSSPSHSPLFIQLAHSRMSHYGNLRIITQKNAKSRMWDGGRQLEQMQDAPGVALTRCVGYYRFRTPSA